MFALRICHPDSSFLCNMTCAIIVFTKLAKHAELEKTGASLFKRALTLFHWVVASRAFVFKSILQIVDPH